MSLADSGQPEREGRALRSGAVKWLQSLDAEPNVVALAAYRRALGQAVGRSSGLPDREIQVLR